MGVNPKIRWFLTRLSAADQGMKAPKCAEWYLMRNCVRNQQQHKCVKEATTSKEGGRRGFPLAVKNAF